MPVRDEPKDLTVIPDKHNLTHYAQHAPIECWDDFLSLLVEFISLADASAYAMGAAIQRGWETFGAKRMGRTEFVEMAASGLPISRASVFRAWFYYLYPDPPADMSPTTLYEIASKGGGEDAVQAAIEGHWSAFDARCVGTLVQRQLLDEWILPHLYVDKGGRIVVQVDGTERVVGRLDVSDAADNTVKAGVQLLRLKARI